MCIAKPAANEAQFIHLSLQCNGHFQITSTSCHVHVVHNVITITLLKDAWNYGTKSLSQQCFLVSPPPPGLPLAPGEVEVVGEKVHQLRVTWIPPFSLPGEIISYSLLVTDEAMGFTSSLGPLNDTSFTHQISERQALYCHLYSFSVFSLNDVGLSLNSSSSSTPALHPSGELHRTVAANF